MTEQELKELRERNAERVKQKIIELGAKWILHPDNAATKEKHKSILESNKKAQLNK